MKKNLMGVIEKEKRIEIRKIEGSIDLLIKKIEGKVKFHFN